MGALFTTVPSIRVSRVGGVTRVSVMVSVRDSVTCKGLPASSGNTIATFENAYQTLVTIFVSLKLTLHHSTDKRTHRYVMEHWFVLASNLYITSLQIINKDNPVRLLPHIGHLEILTKQLGKFNYAVIRYNLLFSDFCVIFS